MNARQEMPGIGAPPTINPKIVRRERASPAPEVLAEKLMAGDPAALSQAITLAENPQKSHEKAHLFRALRENPDSLRIGITGVPGVGKSSLIEHLGLAILEDESHRLAVLTLDPTSSASKGSILGDKSRLQDLSRHERCFIRPSPTGSAHGGVGHSTREAIALCEAWGATVVIVETVGVGQVEVAVREMVDVLLLLALAGAGDELQGIKRGILELADVIAVTKADGTNRIAAEVAAGQVRGALSITGQRTPVELVSIFDGISIRWLLQSIEERCPKDKLKAERRLQQALAWTEALMDQRVYARYARRESRAEWIQKVEQGQLRPEEAAERWMETWKDEQ